MTAAVLLFQAAWVAVINMPDERSTVSATRGISRRTSRRALLASVRTPGE